MSRSLLRSSLRLKSSLRPATTLLAASRRHASDWSSLQSELPARKIPLSYDYLVPTPSHLLNIAVADVFPSGPSSSSSSTEPRILPTATAPTTLPPAHHLIYFPPAIPGRDLLPDGTDPLQSPGGPFVRRMWAGGSVHYNNDPAAVASLALDGGRVACVESIKDVAVKGKEGDEKIFVGIERRIGRCTSEDESEQSVRQRLVRESDDDFGESSILERRNIVFMRERSRDQAVKDMEKAKTKMLRPPEEGAQFEHSFVPNPKLLFRYSALTYNAHAIHLDPQYCREVEGHRDLLFHGPLSFTMLMMLLRVQIAQTKGKEVAVKSVEYRNLAPLYCNEVLKVCGREKEEGKWEIWAETPEGGVAVKGTVRTESAQPTKYADLAMMGY